MIKNFRDHAANQRTFLAWVRTAITVMAFGFLVERFDLFAIFIAPAIKDRVLWMPGQELGNVVGLALVMLGIVMIALAGIRLLMTADQIDDDKAHRRMPLHIDLALALLLVFLGCALFLYISHAFVTKV